METCKHTTRNILNISCSCFNIHLNNDLNILLLLWPKFQEISVSVDMSSTRMASIHILKIINNTNDKELSLE